MRARVIARALARLSKRLLLLFSSAVDPDAEGRLGEWGIRGSDNKKNWHVPNYNIQYLTVSVRSEFEFSTDSGTFQRLQAVDPQSH